MIAKSTFLEEIRGIQNCMAGKAYKLNSSNTENRGPLRPLPLAPVYNTSILHVIWEVGAYATTFLLSFSYLLLASKMLIIITLLKVNLDGNSRVPPKKKKSLFYVVGKKMRQMSKSLLPLVSFQLQGLLCKPHFNSFVVPISLPTQQVWSYF